MDEVEGRAGHQAHLAKTALPLGVLLQGDFAQQKTVSICNSIALVCRCMCRHGYKGRYCEKKSSVTKAGRLALAQKLALQAQLLGANNAAASHAAASHAAHNAASRHAAINALADASVAKTMANAAAKKTMANAAAAKSVANAAAAKTIANAASQAAAARAITDAATKAQLLRDVQNAQNTRALAAAAQRAQLLHGLQMQERLMDGVLCGGGSCHNGGRCISTVRGGHR